MRWEYKTVTVKNYEYVYDGNNSLQSDWKVKDLHSGVDGLLNELGLDGWELVSVTHRSESKSNRFYFKREKEKEKKGWF